MELTAAQRRIVEHDGGPLRVAGGAGCGKTTALVHRYLRLVAGGERPSSVLVVYGDGAAATRFRHLVQPALPGGFDAVPITTWFGVAFDLVTQVRGPVRLLSTSEQRAIVRRLLALESPHDWPEFGHYLGREAFAGEVATALVEGVAGCPELDRFAERYRSVLDGRHEVDRAQLLAVAATLAQPGRYAHVLVDDHARATDGLLAAVAGAGTVVVSEAPGDVTLDEPFRRPAAGVLVTCRHPSTEAEAVAGELRVARAEGVPWSEMAVLVDSGSRHGRSVARALSRHGIPVASAVGVDGGGHDPAAAAIVDLLPEAVTVTTIAGAAGREWHTVIIAGCVEGVLPRIRGRAPLFGPAPASPAEARQASLAEERRRFATACGRATARLVATAGPEPGVLLSRFVEGWDRRAEKPPAFRGPAPASRAVTVNPLEVFPHGELTLSASQLSTYDDCPLRYAYQYGLRVKDDAGPAMTLGTIVHEVLAEFLRPEQEGEHSREALLAIAADHWREDIARYRPQVEECRRDYYAMLETWWAGEGEGLDRRHVLKVEHGFDIQVAGVRLVGAIDRIDRTADGEGIRIVDYKTGGREPRPDSLPDDIQLAVYHLAATLDSELAAFGPPRRLELLFLRTMHAFEQPIRAGHAGATTARVLAAAGDIRSERFEPAVDASCRNCSFHRLCPLQREGREVGAA